MQQCVRPHTSLTDSAKLSQKKEAVVTPTLEFSARQRFSGDVCLAARRHHP